MQPCLSLVLPCGWMPLNKARYLRMLEQRQSQLQVSRFISGTTFLATTGTQYRQHQATGRHGFHQRADRMGWGLWALMGRQPFCQSQILRDFSLGLETSHCFLLESTQMFLGGLRMQTPLSLRVTQTLSSTSIKDSSKVISAGQAILRQRGQVLYQTIRHMLRI